MKIGILGGGPSGLALARFLELPCEILEKESECGGLARSFNKEGFTYDQGGHILFSKDTQMLDLMLKTLGDNCERYYRNNKILFKGRYVKYPFENGLGDLDKEDTYECLRHYLFNSYPPSDNFEGWLYHNFGQGLAEKYLIPYNAKIWKRPPSEMEIDWVEGRIPKPPPEDVIKSALGIPTEGYTHQLYFHYPKKGGNQALWRAFEAQLPSQVRIFKNFSVSHIEKQGAQWVISDRAAQRRYDSIINCMPIYNLLQSLADVPGEVMRASQGLAYNSLAVVLVGVDKPHLNDKFAVYVPQEDIVFHRICFMGYMGESCVPKGKSSVVAEITYNEGDAFSRVSDQEITRRVVSDLEKLSIVQAKDVCVTDIFRTSYAYVIHAKGHAQYRKIVFDYLESIGIQSCGRFAELNYINQDGALRGAWNLAQKLRKKSPRS